MGKEVKAKYDAVVVGAGIGGMLSSAFLVKKGYATCMLEQLSFLGGKFTGFDYKGCQVPSGAFHMLPGGEHGNLGRCFRELGVDFEICYPKIAMSILENGKRYQLSHNWLDALKPDSFFWRFSWKEIVSFVFLNYFLMRKDITLPDISFAELVTLFSGSSRVKKFFDQLLIFANGTNCELSSLIEFKESLRASNYSKEGLVKGGCKNLIKRLEANIKMRGGDIFTKTPAQKFILDGNKVTGIELADGRKIEAGLVVTNVGPKRTIKMLNGRAPQWFREKQKNFKSTFGISYSICTDSPLVTHDSVELPLDYDHICGYVQISNLDPDLAPPGKHYMLAAQMVVDPDMTAKDAVAGGIKDLLSIFPQLTREHIISTSCFHKDWAGCPTQQRMRQSGPDRYPIRVDPFENLYMVSHDSQGWGFSGDLVGHAAWTFNQMI